jgi:hypothetical protein
MDYKEMQTILEEFLNKKFLNGNKIIQRRKEYIIYLANDCEEQQEIYECDHNKKKIIINLLMIHNIAKEEAKIKQLINYASLCGLIEATATNYEKKTCGFGNISTGKYCSTIEREGLTKAYIELLASRLLNRGLEENPNYVAMMLAQQLELIVGEETMLEALFKEDKAVLKRKLQSIDPNSAPKELLEEITQIQKRKTTYEVVKNIQEIFKELFVITIKKQEEQNNQDLKTLQDEVNARASNTNEKISQSKKYLTDLQETLEMSKKLQEERNYRQRQIKDKYAKFSGSIISKEIFDKYIGNWQK